MTDELTTTELTTVLGERGISTTKFTCRECGQEVNPMAAHYCIVELFKMVRAIKERIDKLESLHSTFPHRTPTLGDSQGPTLTDMPETVPDAGINATADLTSDSEFCPTDGCKGDSE